MARKRGRPPAEPAIVHDDPAAWLKGGLTPDLMVALGVTPEPELPPEAPERVGQRRRARALELIREAAKRRCETLRIYEPMPAQAAFHEDPARQRVVYGSNRSGKTSCAAVEFSWAVTGRHPDAGRYPAENGRAIVVAKDEEKIGEVIWYKLGRAGAFKMCWDDALSRWRIYDPTKDEGKGLKVKPAPPLIPPRMIRDIAWISKKKGIPDKVMLKNGWEINFYSSKAVPDTIQGMDVDLGWFDEEIEHERWYPEMQARLIDRMGRFFWSATPEIGTPQLLELHLKAQDLVEAGAENPLVTEHLLLILDNPYLPEQAKRDFIDSLSPEQQAAKVHGQFVIAHTLIYDSYFFPRGIHGVDAFPVPAHWTRFAAIDPGSQVCAILFAAVPPPRPEPGSGLDPSLYGDFVYLYDEQYIRKCDADLFARRLKDALGDQEIATFLIDHHGGRATEVGSGKTPEQQYVEALRRHKVRQFAGRSFTYGSDDLNGGILRVKEFLRVREDGTSKLRVLRDRLPNLIREMARYQWQVIKGEIQDKPVKKNDHLADCLRYICMHPGLRYRAPRPAPAKGPTGAYQLFRSKAKARRERLREEAGAGVTLA